jgi:hypothetical protein
MIEYRESQGAPNYPPAKHDSGIPARLNHFHSAEHLPIQFSQKQTRSSHYPVFSIRVPQNALIRFMQGRCYL